MQSATNNEGGAKSNMTTFLQKVRERQTRTLEEKAAKWGFDFAKSVPQPLQDNSDSVKSDTQESNSIEWKPFCETTSDRA